MIVPLKVQMRLVVMLMDKDERTWMIRRISSRAAVELKSVGNTIPAALVGKDVMASNASR